MEDKLIVNELYDQLTWQGEGLSLGQLCSFIRLGGCPLSCCYCDSAFTWRYSDKFEHNFAPVYNPKAELHQMTVDKIVEHFVPMNPPMIIITGGEPLIQAKKLPYLITELINRIPALTRIEIETAGIIFDEELVKFPFVFFNVSPKLENSKNTKEMRYKPKVLSKFRDSKKAVFKFVVSNQEDLDEVKEIVSEINIPNEKVFIMPEGITEETQKDRLNYLSDKVLENRWNLTTRLHILVWGNKRGV